MVDQKRRSGLAALATVALAVSVQGCATMSHTPTVATQAHCIDTAFQIYFPEESATVSRAARQVIGDAAARTKGCTVSSVEIVGLADFRGPADANLTLSRQRGEAVAEALAKSGFPAPSFRVEAAGEAGAVTAQGQIEPLRRRADVFVRYAKP